MRGPVFGGEIGLVGLFDVCQLLTLNQASGTLHVTSAQRRGSLWFVDGRIVNASDGTREEGELASYHVLSWKRGRFEFRPGSPECPILIERTPQSLLLEAARRMDEESEPDPDGGPEAEKLQEHAREMLALRDAFDDAAREAGRIGQPGGPADLDDLLAAIREAGDRVLLRVGRSPRLWSQGVWSEIGAPYEAAHLATAMERLAARSQPGSGDRRVVRLAGGRAVVLNGHPGADALWIAPAELPPPTADTLRGPHEPLAELIDLPRALLLAGSATPAHAQHLFHALVPMIAARRRGTVLLVTEDPTYRHPDGASVVVQVAPAHASETIRRLRPNVVALDLASMTDATLYGAIVTVPMILGTVIAAELEDVLPLWLSELPPRVRVERLLSSIPVGVVLGDPPAFEDVPMGFRVRVIVRAMRSLAARRHTPISADPLSGIRR